MRIPFQIRIFHNRTIRLCLQNWDMVSKDTIDVSLGQKLIGRGKYSRLVGILQRTHRLLQCQCSQSLGLVSKSANEINWI